MACTIPSQTIIAIGDWFCEGVNDAISYDCTYSPQSASMDFGYLDTANVFHYVNCTAGSIDISIKLGTAGQYRLAIRNNASYAVTVTGSVEY